MKLFAASALALCLTVAIGCAEGNTTTPETEATIANATNKVEANVTGMDCTGCSYGIETALKEVPGVTAAKANHATGEVTVALADDADAETAKAEIEKAIAGLSEGKFTVETINVSIKEAGEGEATDEPAADEPAAEEPAGEEQASTDTEEVFVFTAYKVTGMDCTGCSGQIESAVKQVAGVEKVEANHMDGTVKVSFADEFDDKKKTDEIKDVIAGLSGGKYKVSY